METVSQKYFEYPSNLNVLDLATLVSMYRDRGAPKKADPGEYFACALTNKVMKQGKWWFGKYYSQNGWDTLLSSHSEGYPLTEVELNILGQAAAADEPPSRESAQQNSGAIEKLAFMIVNDLKGFGFLSIDDQERLLITPRGEQALNGIAESIHNKKFSPNMLHVHKNDIAHPTIEKAPRKDTEQTNLF